MNETVTYTVKEMFAEISASMASGFARIEARLDGKADKTDVEKVQTKLEEFGHRLEAVEDRWRDSDRDKDAEDRHEERYSSRRQRMWNYSLGALTILGTIGAALLEALIR
jgi:hypothetical protein